MELRQLRHFVFVAEELHFGRAADRLGMTQPPLSQSIQRLEAELGARLFERTHRSVELTPAGRQLLPYAAAILAEAAALPGLARRFVTGDEGALRIAFVSTADYGVLPALLRRFSAAHPRVKIDLREATGDVQIEALLSEDIDAGLLIGAPATPVHAALDYLPLTREKLIAALPAVWIERGRVTLHGGHVALDSVGGAPLLLFPRRIAPALHDAVTGCYAARGLVPRVGQEAIQMQTIVSLVSAGMGIAIVPESIRNLGRAGVTYVDFEGGSPEIETGLAWRRSNPSPTLRELVRAARGLEE